jgi:CheY-like chemotaxis protein
MTSPLRVLVCDDDEMWKRIAEEQLEPFGDHVEVEFFTDPDQASLAVRSRHYDAAFIDIYFPVGPGIDQDPKGIDLSRTLASMAPSCKQVLMTRFAARGFSQIFEYVWSFDGASPAVVNKSAQRVEYFYDFVEKNFSRRLQRVWSMPDVSKIAESLIDGTRRRGTYRRSEVELEREIRNLLFDLFDEAASIELASRPPALQIERHHFGQSGSIVLETRIHYGQDETDSPVLGTRCVVKIGSLKSTKQEEKRYRELVRMGVPVEFRVELLQTAYGDDLGAICYSFAGGESEEIESFDELLVAEAADQQASPTDVLMPRSTRVLSELFDTQRRSWHAIVGKSEAIADFYSDEFGTDFLERIRQMANFVRKQEQGRFNGESGEWSLKGFKMFLPTRDDPGVGAWRKRSPTCLVHGDLHGGNVLVNSRGTVNMIDFANVSLGPRFVDSTALAATVRLRLISEFPASEISRIYKAEQALIRERTSEKSIALLTSTYHWFGLARTLNQLALKNAARRHEDQEIQKELIMTQLCYSISIFGLPWLNDAQRMRLVVWSAALKM